MHGITRYVYVRAHHSQMYTYFHFNINECIFIFRLINSQNKGNEEFHHANMTAESTATVNTAKCILCTVCFRRELYPFRVKRKKWIYFVRTYVCSVLISGQKQQCREVKVIPMRSTYQVKRINKYHQMDECASATYLARTFTFILFAVTHYR